MASSLEIFNLALKISIPESDLEFFLNLSGSFARGRRRGRSEIPHFCSKLLLFALVHQEKGKNA